MKIAVVDFNAGYAGHTRTALSTACVLYERGHEVQLVSRMGGGRGLLQESGLPLHLVAKSRWGQFSDVGRVLDAIGPLDVVHVFSEEGVAETVAACKQRGIPCFQTICGGTAPTEVLPMGSIISLSEEVHHGILERVAIPGGKVHVLPARVDTAALLERFSNSDQEQYATLRSRYGISPVTRIVLRIARLSPAYERSVLEGARAVARLAAEGCDVAFVYLGYFQQDMAARRVRALFDELNAKVGRCVAVWAFDEAMTASAYVPMADIVIGTGRSAFEAMLAERPVVLVGRRGFAGVVEPSTIEKIAWYNFSGRNQREEQTEAASVAAVAGSVRALLTSQDRSRRLGAFGKAYVLEHLDVRLAAPVLEEIYRAFQVEHYPPDSSLNQALRKFHLRRLARKYVGRKAMESIKVLLSRAISD